VTGAVGRAARWERVALGALAFVVVGAPLPLGATSGWALVGVTVLAGVALLAAVRLLRESGRGIAVPATFWLAVGLAAWTGLQMLPLPCTVAGWVHPAAAESATAAASLTDGVPWCSASLDPGATRERFFVGLGIVCVFMSALVVASLLGRRRVLAWVGVSAVVGAAVGAVHAMSGATQLFGVLSPLHAVPRLVGPFVNPNVAGGMHAVGALVCATLAIDSEARRQTLAWAGLAAMCATMTVVSLSRGAVAALVVGGPLLAFALGARRRGRREHPPLLGARMLLVAPALVVAAVVAADATQGVFGEELGSRDLSKVALIGHAARLVLGVPWTGVGRGAFGVAFAREEGTLQRFEHAESFPIEWAAEWGLVVASIALLVLGRDVLGALRRAKKPAARGALVALVVYGCHNLAELGTEIYGSVLVATVLAGVGLARHADASDARATWSARRFGGVGAVLAVLTVFGVALSAPAILRSQTSAARAELEQLLRNRDRDAFRQSLREATRPHPSEPAFAVLAAAEAVDRDGSDAVRWLTRAMQLAPRWYSPHELAARWLFARGHRAQAVLELREVARLDEATAVRVLCRLPAEMRTADTMLTVARGSRRGVAMAERFVECLDARSNEARRIDEVLLGVRPLMRGPQLRSVRRAIEQGRPEDGVARAERAVTALPGDPEAEVLLGEALTRARQGSAALAALRRAKRAGVLSQAGLLWKARALALEGQFDEMRVVFEELRGLSGGDARAIAGLELQLAALEESAQHHGKALRAYEQAARLHPSAEALRGVMRAAERLSFTDRVRTARSALCELVPSEPGCGSP